jgi:hypothetical protein
VGISLALPLCVAAKDLPKTSVDLRAVYVNYDFDNYWRDSEAFVSSAKLGYRDSLYDDFEWGITFGAIEDFGLSDPDKQSMTYIFNREGKNFAILHQAYLKYKSGKNHLEIGRFEYSSPLIDSDDYYVLSNSFEGINAHIEFDKISMDLGHISRMSGAWDAGYDGGSFVGMSKSVWMHKADAQELVQWPNPVADLGIDDGGVSFVSLSYKDEFMKLQAWDYYAYELMNTMYFQSDFKLSHIDLAFQYIDFNDVGQMQELSDPRAVIDYSVWGAKIDARLADVDISLGYTGVSDEESSHMWGSWGGFPYFASGMMVSYFESSLRDAHIFSLNTTFSPINKLSTTLHAGYYDLNPDYTIDTRGDRNAVDGESAMYTYGVSNSYTYSDRASAVLKLAGRKFPESDNSATYVRMILKYSF